VCENIPRIVKIKAINGFFSLEVEYYFFSTCPMTMYRRKIPDGRQKNTVFLTYSNQLGNLQSFEKYITDCELIMTEYLQERTSQVMTVGLRVLP